MHLKERMMMYRVRPLCKLVQIFYIVPIFIYFCGLGWDEITLNQQIVIFYLLSVRCSLLVAS